MQPHQKRYMVIFSIWDDKETKTDFSEFDKEESWKEEVMLLNNFYQDTPRPQMKQTEDSRRWNKKYKTVFEDGAKYWGYCVLDFEKEQILKWGNDGIYLKKEDYQSSQRICFIHAGSVVKGNEIVGSVFSRKTDQRVVRDLFFRPEDFPKGYSWDDGEYDGWLQFKWGDGKNAIGLPQQKPQQKRKKYAKHNPVGIDDDVLQDLLMADEADIIEDEYAAREERDTKLRLADRW